MDSPRVSCLVLAAPFLFNCVVVGGGGIVFGFYFFIDMFWMFLFLMCVAYTF